MKSKFVFLILCCGLIAASSYYCSQFYSIQQNNLFNNGNWTSSKIALDKGVVAAVAFFTTRRTLAENHLDLGSWHGFNEVLYKQPVKAEKISFDFLIEEKSQLIFIFEKTEQKFKGIRFSTSENFSSALFTGDAAGRYSDVIKLPIIIPLASWSKVSIEFKPRLRIFLNSQLIYEGEKAESEAGQIGFRSQNAFNTKTLVDNVSLEAQDGFSFSDNFSNPKQLRYFFIFFIALSLLAIILKWLLASADFEFKILFIYLSILAVSSLAYWTDYKFFYSTYPVSASQIDRWLRFVDVSHFKNNIEGEKEVMEKAVKRIKSSAPGSYHMTLLGSSQTWGAGASTLNSDLESYLAKSLQEKNKNKKIEIVNLAVSGEYAELQARRYVSVSDWTDLVIINLGNNDGAADALEKNIESLLVFNESKKIKTVLVCEPNFIDNQGSPLKENHRRLHLLAKKFNVPVLELNDYMAEKRELGLLWWDNVHMTSLGQNLAGEFIAAAISPLPKRSRP